ncbi:tetratricopeptide repeat protein [Nonomuraea sp. NPDC049758]|uniref:tetratricopeptide repeat protein n=1 Tax=Nonomuraea sp. NPDC049758 TaxID=3154360 RepID=UPI00342E7520
MDAPPHRLGLERVVEVYSGHDDVVGVTGTGHVIGTDLVLTASLVVDPGAPCQVRPPWSSRWAAAEQVWRGHGAVLLRVPGPPWADVPGIGHLRWAALSGERVPCLAMGFPQARRRSGFRDVRVLSGTAAAPTGPASRTLSMDVPGPPPPMEVWAGLTGAALLAEPAGQVTAVVTASAAGHARGRLDAVPVGVLLRDDRFRELTGAAPGPLERVSAGDGRVVLSGLLLPAREPLPSDCPDWRLLLPRHAVVPYSGRDGQLAALRAWAGEPAALSVAVVTGRSGTGRTRLAGELCEELREAGWDAGFLALDAALAALSGRATVSLEAVRPSLVVVESPEPSAPLVGELVRRLAKHGHNPRVRVLLLAREPGEAEWWRRLDTAAGGWLRRLNTTTVQLNQHPLTLNERTEHAFTAMKAFAPSRAALPTPPRLDDPEYGLPLRVHLAALLRLRGGETEVLPAPTVPDALPGGGIGAPPYRTAPEPRPGTSWNAFRPGGRSGTRTRAVVTVGEELLSRFLDRERDQWATVWPAGRAQVDETTARQSVALLTLTAPTPAELPGLLSAVPALHGDPQAAAVVADWLGRVFPGVDRLCPLGPDLVAEQALAETEGLDALVLAVHDHERRTAGHLARLLDVLRLGTERAEVGRALRSLVTSRIGALVAEAAANPATRLGDLLNAALTQLPADRATTAAVAALPFEPQADAQVDSRADSWGSSIAGPPLGLRALEVTLAELAVRHFRAGGRRTALAGALARLSSRLSAVGRVGEAVVAAAEAVEIFAAAPPYEEAAGQAEALFVLGACLLLAGESGSALRPAQEAATRFRILSEDDPRYAGRAGQAYHNLACALLDSGRTAEAVEAFAAAGGAGEAATALTDILTAHTSPTSPTLAPLPKPPAPTAARSPSPSPEQTPDDGPPTMPGVTRPTAMPDAGQPPSSHATRPATTPVTGPPVMPGVVRRVPAPVPPFAFPGPEPGALPGLAACLTVAVTAAVAGAAPTDRDLAQRLCLLAGWLGEHGRAAEAVAPAAEAVVRLRGLADEEPGLRLMLAEAAGLLAGLHRELDDLDQAERFAAEAVRNLRSLVALEPDEHRPALTVQLLDLGELLLTDARPRDALDPLQDASILASELDERHKAVRARSGHLLALCLAELDRPADARAHAEAAAALYDTLSTEDASYQRHREEIRAWQESTTDPTAAAAGEPEQPWMTTLITPPPDVARAERTLLERRAALEPTDSPAFANGPAVLQGPPVMGDPGVLEGPQVMRSPGVVEDPQVPAGPPPANGPQTADRPRAADGPQTRDGPQAARVQAYTAAQAALARAWAETGRARDGLLLATQAADLLRRHATPDAPGDGNDPNGAGGAGLNSPRLDDSGVDGSGVGGSGVGGSGVGGSGVGGSGVGGGGTDGAGVGGTVVGGAVVGGAVVGAVGRALVGLGRYSEAVPYLRGAVEACGPQAEVSFVVQQELAKLLVLEVVALEATGRLEVADGEAERLVAVCEGLVAERLESPVVLAGALRLHAGLRLAAGNVAGALQSVTRALDILVPEPPDRTRLLTATCLELSGLCHADLDERDLAAAELAKGVALMAEEGPLTRDLAGVHVRALARLARLRVTGHGPSAGTDLYAQILRVRPLPHPDVLTTAVDELSAHLRAATPRTAARLLPLLTAFAEALEREAPVSENPLLHERFGRCLMLGGATAAPAVRVLKGLAAFDARHRHSLGLALAALGDADLTVLEQAVDLLSEDGRALADTLNRYAVRLLEAGRPVEALAHSERAADLCDELDEPAVAAVTYAQLGAALAALDRPQAALEAVTWSLAEQERAAEARGGEAGLLGVRAQAIQVRGQVLRASGRTQEALAHLVEAMRLHVRLARPAAAAEVAGTVADDLLAAGRPEEAAEYARIAVTGLPPRTLRHALATQRLVRCHMMLGEAREAGALAEELIRLARRSPGELTYRAILADSLAQSSELLPLLRPGAAAEAEQRAREAIAIYDELLTTGMNAEALHVSRAGAGLTLAAALRLREQPAAAVGPLREAVAVLERHAPANPLLGGILSRALLMLGDALMESGRALEASLVFHRGAQVIDDEPAAAVAHARLGFCQQELGRDDAADTALRVAHGLLRGLLTAGGTTANGPNGGNGELTELLRDVLRGRLRLLEKSGRREEAAQVEAELRTT